MIKYALEYFPLNLNPALIKLLIALQHYELI